jgi:hypothetical protein
MAWTALAVAGPTCAAPLEAVDLSGRYTLHGENPDGSRYTGELSIRPQGQGWRVEWRQPSPAQGIGISDGNTLVVAFGPRNCGVVAWDVGADGSLDGQWSTDGRLGQESATPMAAGRGLSGRYAVSGRNVDGSAYRGTLDLRADAGGYALDWQTGNAYRGTALEYGGILAGAWGPDCGVVVYRIGPRELQGAWRTPGSGSGQETLLPQR